MDRENGRKGQPFAVATKTMATMNNNQIATTRASAKLQTGAPRWKPATIRFKRVNPVKCVTAPLNGEDAVKTH